MNRAERREWQRRWCFKWMTPEEAEAEMARRKIPREKRPPAAKHEFTALQKPDLREIASSGK